MFKYCAEQARAAREVNKASSTVHISFLQGCAAPFRSTICPSLTSHTALPHNYSRWFWVLFYFIWVAAKILEIFVSLCSLYVGFFEISSYVIADWYLLRDISRNMIRVLDAKSVCAGSLRRYSWPWFGLTDEWIKSGGRSNQEIIVFKPWEVAIGQNFSSFDSKVSAQP